MSQITLRGMDDEVEKRIRRMARQKGKSLNRVILDMIYEYTGRKKKSEEPQARSLRKLAGGWSQKQADEFLESIKSCEQIDEAVWK
jgi:fructose-bisphosphate aldolase class 1